MSILGVVLRTTPQLRDAVNRRLHGLVGVDVVADHGDGRWVIVLEDTPDAERSAAARLGEMATWPELHSTSLVYEYSGPDAPAPGDGPTDYRAWRDNLARS